MKVVVTPSAEDLLSPHLLLFPNPPPLACLPPAAWRCWGVGVAAPDPLMRHCSTGPSSWLVREKKLKPANTTRVAGFFCGSHSEDRRSKKSKGTEKIKDVLCTVSERERQVLELRFGLLDGYGRTLEELGRQFKVTRERIRQIEAKALRKMRHPTRAHHLEGFLEASEN